jgi:hypothetical protein
VTRDQDAQRDVEQARLEQERSAAHGASDQPAERRGGHRPGLRERTEARERDEALAEDQAEPATKEQIEALTPEEYRERERERDAKLPLAERRPEFLTEDERTERVEQIHRDAPPGFSPTARMGD